MTEILNSIDPSTLLAMGVIVAIAIGFAVVSYKDRERRRIVVARIKGVTAPTDDDVRMVRARRSRTGHVITWPREWSSPDDAVIRGADLAAELWPEEQPMPLERTSRVWRQRTTR